MYFHDDISKALFSSVIDDRCWKRLAVLTKVVEFSQHCSCHLSSIFIILSYVQPWEA